LKFYSIPKLLQVLPIH